MTHAQAMEIYGQWASIEAAAQRAKYHAASLATLYDDAEMTHDLLDKLDKLVQKTESHLQVLKETK